VLATLPHDTTSFTEGLQRDGTTLWEGTGLAGLSELRELDPTTGAVVRSAPLPGKLWGEGVAVTGDTIWQLTYQDGVALQWDKATLKVKKQVALTGEGWGLCFDGNRLVQSDGSATLRFRNPTTFAQTGALTVTLDGGSGPMEVLVGTAPTTVEVEVSSPGYDVINNVGSRLVLGGYGGDRGFLEPDEGQYSQPEEVFAWCGGAVLLSARYLRDVGTFDDRYFMYYEDTDLSWRGRLAGWRYCYVPSSVVRHEHAASSKEGSTLFMHFVERNRFLTLARNAPWSMFAEASYVYLRDTAVILDRDVVRRVRHRARPAPGFALRRLRAYAGFVKLLPETLRTRRAQGASAADRAGIVERWGVPQ